MCTIDKWSTTAGSHIARASCTSRVDGRPRECGTHQKLQVRDGARIAVPAAVTRGKPARLGVEVIQQPVDAALEPLVAAQSERRPVQLVSAVRHLVEVPAREEAEGSRRGGISGTRGEQARLAQHLVVAAFIQTLGTPIGPRPDERERGRDGVVLCRPALPPVGSSFSRDTKRGEARHLPSTGRHFVRTCCQRAIYQPGRHLQERPSKAGEPSPGRTTWGRSSEQSPAGWGRPRPEGASRAETPEAAALEAGLWRRPRRPPLGREAAPCPPHRLDPPPPPPLSGRVDRAAASTLARARVPPKRRRGPVHRCGRRALTVDGLVSVQTSPRGIYCA